MGGKLNHMMESHILEDLAIEKWEWAHGAHHCKVLQLVSYFTLRYLINLLQIW